MVIWLVGLSGVGKTTVGHEVYRLWKPIAPNTVMVDGDIIRRIFQNDSEPKDYTVKGRRKNAERIVEICKWLDQQEINVICCILSIFEDVMKENRTLFREYFQVYLDAPLELLKERDTKGLYKKAEEGVEKNVVGVDIPLPDMKDSDLTIKMNHDTPEPSKLASNILLEAGVYYE